MHKIVNFFQLTVESISLFQQSGKYPNIIKTLVVFVRLYDI